jgi:phage terminase small subunit|tara:strand:+ start:87 stop:593 length:507 start_codon:yes stop_codon:yes gene_type:complete
MVAMPHLTEKQRKFAELLVYNEGRMTPTECAIEAGYAKGSAYSEASRLKNANNYPLVAKYIGELRDEARKKYEVSFESHVAELGKIRQEALKKGAFSAAANAEVARGKAAGLYIEQRISLSGKIEDMSMEALEAKMKKIYDDNKVIIEGEIIEEDDKVKIKDVLNEKG